MDRLMEGTRCYSLRKSDLDPMVVNYVTHYLVEIIGIAKKVSQDHDDRCICCMGTKKTLYWVLGIDSSDELDIVTCALERVTPNWDPGTESRCLYLPKGMILDPQNAALISEDKSKEGPSASYDVTLDPMDAGMHACFQKVMRTYAEEMYAPERVQEFDRKWK